MAVRRFPGASRPEQLVVDARAILGLSAVV
jgi:hypothetical protein